MKKSCKKDFWEKEFPSCVCTSPIATKIRKISEDKRFLKEYAEYCTLHGVHYVFKEKLSFCERMLWFVVLCVSFASAFLLVDSMWNRYNSFPTTTVVKDTHLPLEHVYFPAISVCSTDKIKRHSAMKYLSKYLDLNNETISNGVNNFLTAMSLLQHPVYDNMDPYLTEFEFLLPTLSPINLAHFMLHVKPRCEDIFFKCFWMGKETNCCEIFVLQRTEEGYCYAFNSLVAYETSQNAPELRRNNAAGSLTGLEVYLLLFDESERIVNASETLGQLGNHVRVYANDEFPEVGIGNFVPSEKALKLTATIKTYVTISSNDIRHLSLSQRNCYFPDEHSLSVTWRYTQKSCYLQCRIKHLENVCQCRPYYFASFGTGNSYNACNASQLKCISNHTNELRFLGPPKEVKDGFPDHTEDNQLMNCWHCLPTCHETSFDIDTNMSPDSRWLSLKSYGTLDIFYKNEGVVEYQRDLTFGWIDLLVSFGGIAGLFLGFSLLSIVEIIFWILKFVFAKLRRLLSNR